MDIGPCVSGPLVLSNDYFLYVSYLNQEGQIITFEFEMYLMYSIGAPNHETLSVHEYSKFGVFSGGVYEVQDSELIEKYRKVESQHPGFNEKNWQNYIHFVMVFHDSLFECVAEKYRIIEQLPDGKHNLNSLLNDLMKGSLD